MRPDTERVGRAGGLHATVDRESAHGVRRRAGDGDVVIDVIGQPAGESDRRIGGVAFDRALVGGRSAGRRCGTARGHAGSIRRDDDVRAGRGGDIRLGVADGVVHGHVRPVQAAVAELARDGGDDARWRRVVDGDDDVVGGLELAVTDGEGDVVHAKPEADLRVGAGGERGAVLGPGVGERLRVVVRRAAAVERDGDDVGAGEMGGDVCPRIGDRRGVGRRDIEVPDDAADTGGAGDEAVVVDGEGELRGGGLAMPPRSVSTPSRQTTAREPCPATSLCPAITPALLIFSAKENWPPSEGRRTIWPSAVHITGRMRPDASLLKPTTTPSLLMPCAAASVAPGSEGRTMVWPFFPDRRAVLEIGSARRESDGDVVIVDVGDGAETTEVGGDAVVPEDRDLAGAEDEAAAADGAGLVDGVGLGENVRAARRTGEQSRHAVLIEEGAVAGAVAGRHALDDADDLAAGVDVAACMPVPRGGSGSWVVCPLVQMKAWLPLLPTTSPSALMPYGVVKLPMTAMGKPVVLVPVNVMVVLRTAADEWETAGGGATGDSAQAATSVQAVSVRKSWRIVESSCFGTGWACGWYKGPRFYWRGRVPQDRARPSRTVIRSQ